MMRIVLVSALLLSAGLVLLPEAAAECPPPLDNFRPCQRPLLPSECWYYPETGAIECKW